MNTLWRWQLLAHELAVRGAGALKHCTEHIALLELPDGKVIAIRSEMRELILDLLDGVRSRYVEPDDND